MVGKREARNTPIKLAETRYKGPSASTYTPIKTEDLDQQVTPLSSWKNEHLGSNLSVSPFTSNEKRLSNLTSTVRAPREPSYENVTKYRPSMDQSPVNKEYDQRLLEELNKEVMNYKKENAKLNTMLIEKENKIQIKDLEKEKALTELKAIFEREVATRELEIAKLKRDLSMTANKEALSEKNKEESKGNFMKELEQMRRFAQDLSEENEKLRFILEEKERSIKTLIGKNEELAQSNSDKKMRLSTIQEEKSGRFSNSSQGDQSQRPSVKPNPEIEVYRTKIEQLLNENEQLKTSVFENEKKATLKERDLEDKCHKLTMELSKKENEMLDVKESMEKVKSSTEKDLKDKLTQEESQRKLVEQINLVIEENTRLNESLRESMRAYEDLSVQYSNLEKEIQSNLRLFDDQRKSNFSDRSALEQALKSAHQALNTKESNERDIIKELQAVNEERDDLLRDQKNTVKERDDLLKERQAILQDRQLLSESLSNLKGFISKVTEENERLKVRLNSLELEFSERGNFHDREKVKLSESSAIKDEIINNMKLTIESLKAENMDLQSRIKEMEERSKMILHNEMEKLRFQALEYQQISIGATEDLEKKFRAERAAYETHIMQLISQLKEHEALIKRMEMEIVKANNIREEKSREAEENKRKLILANSEIKELMLAVENAKKQNQSQSNTIGAKEKQREILENEIKKINTEKQYYLAEIDRLYKIQEQRQLEEDRMRAEINELRKEVIKINQEISMQSRDSSTAQVFENLNFQLEELRQQNENLKYQSERNRDEVATRKNDLSKRIKELEDVFKKHDEARRYLERFNKELSDNYLMN